MTNDTLIPFSFEGKSVRIITRDGELWWVLTDVCDVLGIRNSRDAADRLDDDEKADVAITDTSSNGVTQRRTVTIINESGLWSLVLTSRKLEAKLFKKWLTSEVIPTIRKTGGYGTQQRATVARRKRKQPMDIAFKQFKNIAALIGGLDETQQIIAADRGVYSLLGRSPLSEMGMSSLPAPTNDAYLTPTELGKKMGDLSARKVNKMLADKGLQVHTPGSASGSPWAMTKAGEPYGRMHDTSRRNGTGSQQQLKWKPTVLDLISGKGEAA